MTLIVSLITPMWTAIVADRMLSMPDGTVVSSVANKLVLFKNEMVFGYTGQAKLPDTKGHWQNTDEWLVDVLRIALATDTATACLERICVEAEQAVERYRRNTGEIPRMAFLGSGWSLVQRGDRTSIEPVRSVISNFHDVGLGTLKFAEPSFQLHGRILGAKPFELSYVGQTYLPDEEQWLTRQVRRQVERDAAPTVLLSIMKQSVRQVSKRLNHRWVGKDLLAAILPGCSAFQAEVAVLNPQSGAGTVFLPKPMNAYIEAGEKLKFVETGGPLFWRFSEKSDSGVFESPHVVCPGCDWPGLLIPKPAEESEAWSITAQIPGARRGHASCLTRIKIHHAVLEVSLPKMATQPPSADTAASSAPFWPSGRGPFRGRRGS